MHSLLSVCSDVKYVPFCDAIEHAETPDWVRKDVDQGEPLEVSDVIIPKRVRAQMQECWDAISCNIPKSSDGSGYARKSLYSSCDEFVELVLQVLERDIRSVFQRQKDLSSGTDTYHLHLESMDISYVYINDSKTIHLKRVELAI